MVDAHEPIHDTGERRTCPNMMSREGARGQEYNAWGGEGGNPPEHETILFFTRLLAGPMDFTPGIFDLLIAAPDRARRARRRSRACARRWPSSSRCTWCSTRRCRWRPTCRRTTRTSRRSSSSATWRSTGTRRACSTGGSATTWSWRASERGGRDWFLGAITDEEARTIDVPLSFLPRGQRYVAEIYADGPGANWRDQPAAGGDLAAAGDVGVAAAGGARAGRRTGDPHPAGAVTDDGPLRPTPFTTETPENAGGCTEQTSKDCFLSSPCRLCVLRVSVVNGAGRGGGNDLGGWEMASRSAPVPRAGRVRAWMSLKALRSLARGDGCPTPATPMV